MSHYLAFVIGENHEKDINYFDCDCEEHYEFEDWTEAIRKLYDKDSEKSQYATFEEYCIEKHGFVKNGDKYGMYSNPNTMFDWCQLGGRWCGYFLAKKQPKYPKDMKVGKCGINEKKISEDGYDLIRKCDIDIDAMFKREMEDVELTWKNMEESNSAHFRRVVYCIKDDENKEQYIERRKKEFMVPYAIIKDGEWLQECDIEEDWNVYAKKLLDSLKDDELIAVYDFHNCL